MNHNEYKEKLSALLDGELSDAERETVLLHLRECTDCRTYFEEIYALHLALGDMEEYDAPANFAEGVMERLHGEDAKKVSGPRRRATSPKIWRTWGALAACAAVVLLAVSFLPNALRMKNAAPESTMSIAAAPAAAAPMAPPDETRDTVSAGTAAGGASAYSADEASPADTAGVTSAPNAMLSMMPTEPTAPAGGAADAGDSKIRVAGESGVSMTVVTSGPEGESPSGAAVESALPEVTLTGEGAEKWLKANGWQGESGDWYAEADALRALPEGLSLADADMLPDVYSGPARVRLEEAQP